MIYNLQTPRGMVAIREANVTDATQFRNLRLAALQDSPIAFSADYQTNADQPMSYWEGRLEKEESGTMFFAEYEQRLIGMAGIPHGQIAKNQTWCGNMGDICPRRVERLAYRQNSY